MEVEFSCPMDQFDQVDSIVKLLHIEEDGACFLVELLGDLVFQESFQGSSQRTASFHRVVPVARVLVNPCCYDVSFGGRPDPIDHLQQADWSLPSIGLGYECNKGNE